MDAPDSAAVPPLEPGLYLVGTPIGNMEDITLRALRVLAAADALACEDTRVTRKLFQRHGVAAPKSIFVCNDHNEKSVAKRLAELIRQGQIVAYCSDAGQPGISDPGYNLSHAVREAGLRVEVIPGPTAMAMAVALSGLPAASFTFFGFPPRRDGRLKRILAEHGHKRPALVFYESPRRIGRLLALALEAVGPEREAAVCLELTKKFERVKRGRLDELAAFFGEAETRGEATVIIAGADKRHKDDDDEDRNDNRSDNGVFS